MAEMLLTIQHENSVFSPPIEDGVKLEWERTGSPGKLTFTTVGISGSSFTEGDPVCFYYDNTPVFMGYVFTKKHDKEQKITVTCYDQIRYLKNKFAYVFENKTATQIVEALCKDFNLHTGDMDNTNYVIQAIAEENKSALDIILTVLEDTLLNTGEMFVVYDDFGKIRVRNTANMVSLTLLCSETAENFDFSSSIDNETYNQVILYYKQNDQITQMYTASSPTTAKQWGTLRYFEEVKTPTQGQNKAESLLKLYNRKTRELKITGAFGDISVRGGTLIPVYLNLGETLASNFMLVDKVTHNFNSDYHTMDLTLAGAWDDPKYEVKSETIGELLPETSESGGSGGYGGGYYVDTNTTTNSETEKYTLLVKVTNGEKSGKTIGWATAKFTYNGKELSRNVYGEYRLLVDANTPVRITINSTPYDRVPGANGWVTRNYEYRVYDIQNQFTKESSSPPVYYTWMGSNKQIYFDFMTPRS